MSWKLSIKGKVSKQVASVPAKIRAKIETLFFEIIQHGPVRNNWPNYGKLKGKPGCHHCHLNKGRPRYVVVWRENKDNIELIEVRYVGTHEKADYKRIS